MSSVRQIITSSLRQLGIVGGHGQSPGNYDFADSLFILQSLIRGLINGGALGRMKDVTPAGSYVAGENERVYRTQDDPTQVIKLPDLVGAENVSFEYGRTNYDVNSVRPVRDGAFVSIVDSLSGNLMDFVYSGQQKRWISIAELAVPDYDDTPAAQELLQTVLDMECPLSFGDPIGLAAYLAIKLSPDFGATVPAGTTIASRNFLYSLTHSYSTRDYTRRS